MPRLRSETYGPGDQTWLGSTHGLANARTSVLDLSAFTEAIHYPDGYIPSGTPVNADDESAVVPWAGTGRLGFVVTDQRVVGTADINAPILRHGIINVDNLPVAFTVPAADSNFVFVGAGA